jgi:MFS family permease
VILGAFALGSASLIGFVVAEHRSAEPLLDLRFFRSIPFSGATVTAIAAFAGLGGFLFINTLYLQQSRGLSALRAGLDTLPMAVMTLLLAPVSGRIVGRRGPRLPLLVAGAGLALSGWMLTRMTGATSFTWLFGAYVLFGIGFGVVNAPITNTAMSGMPPAQAGVAAAVASTSRQIGQTLGVAVLGALATSDLRGSLASGLPAASHRGWWTIAGCGVAILLLGLATTSRRALASAGRAAERFGETPSAPVTTPGPARPDAGAPGAGTPGRRSPGRRNPGQPAVGTASPDRRREDGRPVRRGHPMVFDPSMVSRMMSACPAC